MVLSIPGCHITTFIYASWIDSNQKRFIYLFADSMLFSVQENKFDCHTISLP